VARSRGLGRIRYRLQYRHTVRTRISTSITIGPSLTGLRGTQLTGSIIYTLVNSRLDDMATAARGLEEKAGRRADSVSRRRRREEARASLIYGAAASYSRAGGGIDRRWRRGGKMEGVGAGGGDFSRCVFAHVRRDAARFSRRLTFGAPDRANSHAPKKICSAAADTAPAGGPIPSPRAVYRRFF
jgi:hypothetical protein